MSMFQLAGYLYERGIPVTYGQTINESLVPRGRNGLVQRFIATEATHLMFIDSDIIFRPEDVTSLIQADKSVIAGLYPRKDIDWRSIRSAAIQGLPIECLADSGLSYVWEPMNRTSELRNAMEPVEASYCGTGFMLIKRDVFEKLADSVPSYCDDCTKEHFGQIIKEYFATSIDNKRYLSEDYNFCRLVRESGIPVHIAPWVNLVHVGAYNFGNSDRQSTLSSLSEQNGLP